jgi:hypothetical protein
MKRLLLGFVATSYYLATLTLAFLAAVGSHHLGLNGWITTAIYLLILAIATALAIWTTEAQRFIAWAEDEPLPARNRRSGNARKLSARFRRVRIRLRFRRRFGNR